MVRDHAWTHDQYDASHEKDWHNETSTPTHYQVTPTSLHQVKNMHKHHKSHVGETNSTLEPYVMRDHAWTHDQYDASHEKDWHTETTTPTHYQVTPTSLSQSVGNLINGLRQSIAQ